MKRRTVLAAVGAGLVGAGALALHPRDRGAPHASYFASLSAALRAAGIATPTMIIDRDRLAANAARVVHNIGARMQLRLVAKSLPCLPLLDELAATMKTQRLMVFNLPYLQLLAAQRPALDLLLGKPMPVAAAAAFYEHHDNPAFAPARQLQWLVDSPQRLAQYRDLARQRKLPLRINLEIDVGLHRGGVASAAMLQEMLALFQSEPLLQWSGMMGYDAHLAKLPDLPGVRLAAFRTCQRRLPRLRGPGQRRPVPRPAGAQCGRLAHLPPARRQPHPERTGARLGPRQTIGLRPRFYLDDLAPSRLHRHPRAGRPNPTSRCRPASNGWAAPPVPGTSTSSAFSSSMAATGWPTRCRLPVSRPAACMATRRTSKPCSVPVPSNCRWTTLFSCGRARAKRCSSNSATSSSSRSGRITQRWPVLLNHAIGVYRHEGKKCKFNDGVSGYSFSPPARWRRRLQDRKRRRDCGSVPTRPP
ncbi:alanine racemase [Massilia sp. B-10]|nr:alanine racemase [Massilia sp. B-10]